MPLLQEAIKNDALSLEPACSSDYVAYVCTIAVANLMFLEISSLDNVVFALRVDVAYPHKSGTTGGVRDCVKKLSGKTVLHAEPYA